MNTEPAGALELDIVPSEPFEAGGITVQQAIRRYMELRIAEGAYPVKSDSYRHTKVRLSERFCAAFGKMRLADVTKDHIRAWLDSLIANRCKGRPLHPVTRLHHLKSVKAFFRRCVVEEWIVKNPTLAVTLPPIAQTDVTVLPVKDAFHYFKANRDDRAIGRVALEAFGCLRFTSAGRITRDEILFDRRALVLPAAKHKSKKRHFRQGHPENLWSWLEFAPKECWELTWRHYREHKRMMGVIARLRPAVLMSEEDRRKAELMKNVFRHSAASYLLAITKTYPAVSYLMQHQSAKMTEHYEGRASEADARLYFSITPETVLLSWEEFVKRYQPKDANSTATPIVSVSAAQV